MKKKILILEDNLDLLESTSRLFKENGFDTIKCSSIVVAKEIMRSDKKINLICTDLNLATDGLTDEQIENSFGTRIAGWVWLINYVYIDDKNKNIKYIIRSSYIPDLKEYLEDCENINEISLFDETACFEKNVDDEELISYIKGVLG